MLGFRVQCLGSSGLEVQDLGSRASVLGLMAGFWLRELRSCGDMGLRYREFGV